MCAFSKKFCQRFVQHLPLKAQGIARFLETKLTCEEMMRESRNLCDLDKAYKAIRTAKAITIQCESIINIFIPFPITSINEKS